MLVYFGVDDNEMIVDCNGPSINEVDNVLSEAASYYFSKQKTNHGWRFVTKHNIINKFAYALCKLKSVLLCI